MCSTVSARARRSRLFAPAVPGIYFAAALCGATADLKAASPPTQVVRVEEDWELVVNSTDLLATAPQVTTLISPVGHLDDVHAVFELNHCNLPSFQPGGLHLQVWQDRWAAACTSAADASVMAQGEEVVRWTQAIELKEGKLTVEVRQGSSTTWGEFGPEDGLRVQLPTELGSLNDYDPEVSVDNSGVSFAGNRVASLTLVRTRRHLKNGTVIVDESARPVHLPK